MCPCKNEITAEVFADTAKERDELRAEVHRLNRENFEQSVLLSAIKEERDNLERDLKDCRNQLCVACGAYKRSHLGACHGCRWER